jgi:hypothetical protein
MIGAKGKTRFDAPKVAKAARRGSIQSLGHAGAALRLTARRSIRRNARASAPGSPPHTRKGRLKRAIKYAVDKALPSVVIGPDKAIVGTSAAAHEHGGRYRDEHYPRRPFMGPALEKIKDRLPPMWAGSIKGG